MSRFLGFGQKPAGHTPLLAMDGADGSCANAGQRSRLLVGAVSGAIDNFKFLAYFFGDAV
jgi:hypothetical protein